MRFKRKRGIFVSVIIVGILLFIISGGSHNTPYEKQAEYDEVELTKDPEPWSFFDFELPSFYIDPIEGVFELGEGALILLLIAAVAMILLVIGSIVIYRRRKGDKINSVEDITEKEEEDKELVIRRQTLGRRIDEIVLFLKSCLNERYSQGITEGFERLDIALKEYSKISRPGWLTPREYTRLNIPYFNHQALIASVEQFYRVTYGEKVANKEELEKFIESFQRMILDPEILNWEADSEGSR